MKHSIVLKLTYYIDEAYGELNIVESGVVISDYEYNDENKSCWEYIPFNYAEKHRKEKFLNKLKALGERRTPEEIVEE